MYRVLSFLSYNSLFFCCLEVLLQVTRLLLEGLIPFGVDRLVHVLTLITIKRVEIISEGKCSLENFVNIRFLASALSVPFKLTIYQCIVHL